MRQRGIEAPMSGCWLNQQTTPEKQQPTANGGFGCKLRDIEAPMSGCLMEAPMSGCLMIVKKLLDKATATMGQ